MRIVKEHSIYFLVTLLLIAGSPVGAAEKEAWNTGEVLALSDQLYLAARRVKVECRASPPNYTGIGGWSEHFEFRYHVSHFESVTRDLSQALEDGKNKKETQPIYTNLVDIMSDLDSYAGREAGGAWPVVSNAVLKANGYLVELGEYYSQP